MSLQQILRQAHNHDLIRGDLRRRSPLFPKWIEEEREGVVYFSTILRKEHEGEWYIEHHLSSFIETPKVDIHQGRQDFLGQIYLSILVGKIDPELETLDGRRLWEVDENQKSETERLTGYKKEN